MKKKQIREEKKKEEERNDNRIKLELKRLDIGCSDLH